MKSVFARSLFKSYDGINAVDGIELDVNEGQIFGFQVRMVQENQL